MRIAALSCILLLVAATAVAKPVGDSGRGEALTQRWCAACHQPGGAGGASDAAPTFVWIAGQVKQNPGFIRAFLNHPHAPMPPIDLDQAEIADIVAYFDDLSKR